MRRGCMLLWLLAAGQACAATWSLEGSLGAAYHARTRLTIEQGGQESLAFDARYATQAFDSPLYYALRVGRWEADGAWELSLIHDKLYLRNPPPEVESLSISHGFNLLTVNRALRSDTFIYRFGAGVIVTHPEGRVRGVSYDGPYDLAGVVALAGLSKRLYLDKSWFLLGDLAATVGDAKTKADGTPDLTLRVPHAAIHGLLGIGVDF